MMMSYTRAHKRAYDINHILHCLYIYYLNSYKRLKNIIVGTYNLHFRINTLNISISNSRLTFYSFLSLFYNNIIYCIHLLLHNIYIYRNIMVCFYTHLKKIRSICLYKNNCLVINIILNYTINVNKLGCTLRLSLRLICIITI